MDGKCLICEDLGLDDCEKCEKAPNNNNEYICTKCNKWSNLIDGECEDCDNSNEFLFGSKCYECDNIEHGGIKGCNDCERNENNKLICQICREGYILLTNNNTCLDISKNKELEKFDLCEQLTLDTNNQLYCSKCKEEYSLLKDNNKGQCKSLPILYDYSARYIYNYYYEYYRDYNFNYNYEKGYYDYFYDDDYYYYQSYNNYPYQEAINLGTTEKPLYSCTKCYQRFIYEKSYRDAK